MLRNLPNLEHILAGVLAGIIVGLMVVVSGISLSVLIFNGTLSHYVPQGVGFFLFSAIIFSVVVTFLGSIRGVATYAHDGPATVIAVTSTALVHQLTGVVNDHSIFIAVIMVIMFSSLSSGLVLFLIGRFQLGNLIRYIPYPVMGGFLAGTGVLLTRSAIKVVLGKNLELGMLHTLLEGHVFLHWFPSVLGSTIIILILRRFNHFLVWPLMLFIFIILFYTVLYVSGMSIDEAQSQGFLLKPFSGNRLWSPLLLSDIRQVNWQILIANADQLLPVILVTLIGFLLNASSLELMIQRDIDLNYELRVVGLANIFTAFGGGAPGYHSLSFSLLAFRMGAATPVFTITIGLFCAFVLLAGSSFISYIPVALLGGLLMVMGFSFLIQWVYEAWFKMPSGEYFIILTGLVMIPILGFLKWIMIGIVIAAILFILKYSKVDSIRSILTGTIYHAKVDRSTIERNLLRCYGESIQIVRLQGYLFFGTSRQLLDYISEFLKDAGNQRLFIILDFHRVYALDSSALLSFIRIFQSVEMSHHHLVLAHVAPLIRRQLERNGCLASQEVQFFPTLDQSVEWCEDKILIEKMPLINNVLPDMSSQLQENFPMPELVEKLLEYSERMILDKYFYLMRAGDPGDCMYFIESGKLDILLETQGGRVKRLRSIRRGTIVGELGFYLKQDRTAAAVTICKSVVYRLSEKAMEEMELKDPNVASALHEWVASLMAERMADSNRAIEALLD